MSDPSGNSSIDLRKPVFTTGEVAEICQISQQTVIRNFDAGKLRGFRVPGSRFRRIPRESLLQFMRENGIPLESTHRGKHRVLVVDDDPGIVEMLVDLLQRDGRFEVETASSAFAAGVKASEFRPDVIVLDWWFGRADERGDVVVRQVRSVPALANVKIIVVSGVVKRQEIDSVLQSGADAFVAKPFNVHDLIHRIAELVRD
jgi:excisionase family DNA binding protein